MARWTGWHTLVVILVAPVAIFAAAWNAGPVLAWSVAMLALIAVIALIGWGVRGLPRGALIDERNRVSLSRFQTILWTVLVLGGYLIMVVQNVRDGMALDAALVTMPAELLWLLGISATSLVGSPLVRSVQANRQPDEGEIGQLAKQPRRGIVSVNDAATESSWADLFKGEEIENRDMVDLGKVQMFFFTLVAVGVYGVLLGNLLSGGPPFSEFPELTEGIVGLLAISHGAYLANKGVTRTPTA